MELIILFLVVLIYSASLIITYSDDIRRSSFYIPLSLVASILIGLLWSTGIKHIDNKDRIFLFSLCWEFMILIIDYIVPLIFYSLSVNKYVILGSFIVAVGLTIMKLNMK